MEFFSKDSMTVCILAVVAGCVERCTVNIFLKWINNKVFFIVLLFYIPLWALNITKHACVTFFHETLTSVVRCRADTGGIPSLHSLHLSSLSALLVSSLFGVSALLGGWSSFSLRALFSRLQELTDKLTVMLEGHSCLFESHSPSHVNTDPAGNYSVQSDMDHNNCHYTQMIWSCTLMLTAQ